MKRACPIHSNKTTDKAGRTGIASYLESKITWMKEKDFTCPLCKEVCNGISNFTGHIKDHCT